MKRSVIKLAKNTLAITLPNKWVRKFNVEKQDELDTIESNNKLIISTTKHITHSKKIITAQGNARHILRQITIPYRQGIDELEVHFEDFSTLKKIEKILEMTLGYEILERGNKHCIIKDIANLDYKDFDNLFSRYFLVQITLAKDACQILERGDTSEFATLDQLFHTENKLYIVCSRIINKSGDYLAANSNYLFYLVQLLEQVADKSYGILFNIKSDSKISLSKPVLIVYKELILQLENCHKLFYNFDLELGKVILNKRDDINKRAQDLLLKSKGQDAIALNFLLHLNWTLSDVSSAIYGIKT